MPALSDPRLRSEVPGTMRQRRGNSSRVNPLNSAYFIIVPIVHVVPGGTRTGGSEGRVGPPPLRTSPTPPLAQNQWAIGTGVERLVFLVVRRCGVCPRPVYCPGRTTGAAPGLILADRLWSVFRSRYLVRGGRVLCGLWAARRTAGRSSIPSFRHFRPRQWCPRPPTTTASGRPIRIQP